MSTVELNQTKTSLMDAYKNIDWLEGEKMNLEANIQAIYASFSWRITGPIRRVKNIYIKLLQAQKSILKKISAGVKGVVRLTIYKLNNLFGHKPYLKYRCIGLLNHFPWLKYRLKGIIMRQKLLDASQKNSVLPMDGMTRKIEFQNMKIEHSDDLSVDDILRVIKGKLDKGREQ